MTDANGLTASGSQKPDEGRESRRSSSGKAKADAAAAQPATAADMPVVEAASTHIAATAAAQAPPQPQPHATTASTGAPTMATSTPTRTPASPFTGALGRGVDLYSGWIDASVRANERATRLARVWFDESIGFQEDLALSMKRSFDDSRTALSGDTPSTPAALFSTLNELGRQNYALWSEAALKAQERMTRIAKAAAGEMQQAQSELVSETEKGLASFAKAAQPKG